MAIDIYSVPVAEHSYVRNNLFSSPTTTRDRSSIGVNIYQDFEYTQADGTAYLAMTTGVAAVLNHWAQFGIFCSYWFPKANEISANTSNPNLVMSLSNMFYCGNTIGVIPWADKIVHPKVTLDVGFGSAKLDKIYTNRTQVTDYPILVLRPGIFVEANLFSFLQWTLGLKYRFQIGLNSPTNSGHLDTKANWLEVSTGPVFNVR